MIFDTHCHLNDDALFHRYEEYITRATNAKVSNMVVIGIDVETSKRAIMLAEKYDFIYAAVAIHPNELMNRKDQDFGIIKTLAKHPKVVAIGEIGLDYHWKNTPVEIQKEYFLKFLSLANDLKKPVIIHTRESLEDTYSFLNQNANLLNGGIMHCFSGNITQARKFVELGFYISLGGPLTFKNALDTKQIARLLDIKHLLVETDAPYLAPHPFRGKLNEPALITHVVDELAKLKNYEYQEVAKITSDNARKVFGIK